MATTWTPHPAMLSRRALNRAFLARQLLLERAPLPAHAVIEHLTGLQAQAPQAPYVGLWTRIRDFAPDDLSGLLLDRSAVRLVLMRSTVHLVTADDCRWLRPTVQPSIDRAVGPRGWRKLAGVEPAELAATGRAWLDEAPRSAAELNELLGERWPGLDRSLLGRALRAVVPMVQIPPRGVWGRSGQPVYATAETWLPGLPDPVADPELLVRRYLAAFGPASVADLQLWSGLTRLQQTVDALRRELLVFSDDAGTELFDLPDAPRPEPDTPAPVRFLAEFDNAVLAHADRSRIITPQDQQRIMTKNALILGTVLVDGFVRGSWRAEKSGRTLCLVVTPFAALPSREREEVEREGAALLDFLLPRAEDRDVLILTADGS
ncbi:winged helix DNA-binding domain-containing protein (plasmid) [Streptomyces sp. NBC_01591]|uniref:winged helix DNA-binding domain-containing protein n=1 Tax=Streptomyces sp. NBC_01591 TaxID=2975888 RepID=UPI002DDBBB8C|nr:winged helix DNA-binding domain-containing protein [Streptomyces sp. NBC_01591]WSD74775.1 winged helix DNA-binding domain-containing protein [Streptomyces sp. NBC_01591]